uniref:Ig-like domain-containing protein n=1 Tax=Takifugu rubripes TaxID=31033 RepID=H2RXN4_TAKRU
MRKIPTPELDSFPVLSHANIIVHEDSIPKYSFSLLSFQKAYHALSWLILYISSDICFDVASMESLNWKTNFILVKPGQNLTLPCLQKDNVSPTIYWFKQTLGEKPRLICTYRISSKNWKFVNDFKSNPRFQLHPGNKGANLTISDLELSDSATYYCVNQYVNVFDFTEGYKVIVEGSGLTIDQSASQSIQAEGSVTLNCTVHTGWTCDGDHTVYWFRNSGQSQLGLMYSHTGRNKQFIKFMLFEFYTTYHFNSYFCYVSIDSL